LFIHYLENGKTITGEYYTNLLTRLQKKKKRQKNRFAKKKKFIFHQDNTPAHKRILAMGKLRDLHYELLEHPPYSPDLAPSDLFYPSPKLNPFLAGQRFSSNDVATAALERYFADHTKTNTGTG
jgi:histone-lysine N-methyltransferase SETMAR